MKRRRYNYLFSLLVAFSLGIDQSDAFVQNQSKFIAGRRATATITHSRVFSGHSRWLIKYHTSKINQCQSCIFGSRRGSTHKNKTSALETVSPIANAVLLIAGTTVGGGFLAIPSIVSPIGFVPSAAGLSGVWAFFVLQNFVLVDCISNARKKTKLESEDECENMGETVDKDDIDHPGIAATAKSAFGRRGEYFVAALLAVLTEATLVSQISRAGSLFPPSMYRIGCATVALSIGAAVFVPRRGITSAPYLNSALTSVFIISSVLLFAAGLPSTDWSRLKASSNVETWAVLPNAIPTFLQLLVYCEILPTVCRMLRYKKASIRLAIVLGSLLPLLLEVSWAGLGIGLVPSGGLGDPVDFLLAAGPVKAPLFVLAISAILTTIIGSYLALQSIVDDIAPNEGGSKIGLTQNPPQWRRRLFSGASIILPGLMIASISPSLFLRAIDFAGSYPVLFLNGILPPAIALAQGNKMKKEGRTGTTQSKSIIIPLLGVSIFLIGASAVPDLMSFVKMLQTLRSG